MVCLHPFPSPPWLQGTACFESYKQGTVLTAETVTIPEFICYMVEPCLKGKLRQQRELEARETKDKPGKMPPENHLSAWQVVMPVIHGPTQGTARDR